MKMKKPVTLMGVITLCLLLGVAWAAHAADPLFNEYLASKRAGTDAVPSYYAEAEKESVCFRTSSSCRHNCPPLNEKPCHVGKLCPPHCNSYSQIDHLVCAECGDGHRYPGDGDRADGSSFESQLGNAIEAAKCMWYRHETTPVPLAGTNGVSYAGNFYGTCTISTEAGACKLPEACNDITVNVQGVVHIIEDAILVGPPHDPALDSPNGCDERFPTRIANKDATTKVATANVPHGRLIELDAPPSQVQHGPAYVYTGNAEVYGHGMHAPKFPRAHFQYSLFASSLLQGPVAASSLGDLPRLGDDVYRFDFLSQQSPDAS